VGVLIAFPAQSQQATDQTLLAPGMRVRIAAPEVLPHRLVGEISAIDEDTVTVESSASHMTVSIPRVKIDRVELSEGMRSRWVDGGIGAATGAATGAITCAEDNSHSSHGYVRVSTTAVAAACGVVGAGIGALIGALIPPGERWHRMATSSYRLSVMPRLDSELGLSVMLAF
jgi:hypothetical protein